MKMWIESIAFTPYNENAARITMSELIGPPYDTTKPLVVHNLSFFTSREDIKGLKPGDRVNVSISIFHDSMSDVAAEVAKVVE